MKRHAFMLGAAAFAVAGLSGIPAAQAAQSLLDEIDGAKSMLLYEPSKDDFQQQYPLLLAKDLSGQYVPVAIFAKVTESAANLQQACKIAVLTIDASNPFRIRFTRYEGKDNEFTTWFTSMGGTSYAQSTDMKRIEALVKLDATNKDSRLNMMSWVAKNTGTATLLRPSPNVLVIDAPRAPGPVILAKCP